VVSGIAQFYTPESLVGKKLVLVANLKPATLRGVESQGMILAGEDAEGRIVVVTPESDLPPGAKVR
jgi:methionyl-tRNA synthetase